MKLLIVLDRLLSEGIHIHSACIFVLAHTRIHQSLTLLVHVYSMVDAAGLL